MEAEEDELLEGEENGEGEETTPLSDEYYILRIIDHDILDNVDRILYHRHIHYQTRKLVINAFERALYNVMRLQFLPETLNGLYDPRENLKLAGDVQLEKMEKDELQFV